MERAGRKLRSALSYLTRTQPSAVVVRTSGASSANACRRDRSRSRSLRRCGSGSTGPTVRKAEASGAVTNGSAPMVSPVSYHAVGDQGFSYTAVNLIFSPLGVMPVPVTVALFPSAETVPRLSLKVFPSFMLLSSTFRSSIFFTETMS